MNYDVVIVTYNSADVISDTLASVYSSTLLPAKIIVVDCLSSDGTVELIAEKFPDVHLLPQEKNLGFGKGNMIGFTAASSPYILLLNPDVRLEPACGAELLKTIRLDEKLAVVSPLIYEGWQNKERVYGFGGIVSTYGFGINATLQTIHEPNSFTGACALVRKSVAQQYGFESSFFLYYEEPELAVRLLKDGWHFGRTEHAICYHLSGHSGPKEHAQALGFRQYYAIQNRWFMIGRHWPFPLIVPALVFNIFHLAYFSFFYVKQKQFKYLPLIWKAPHGLIRGFFGRKNVKYQNQHWSRLLTPLKVGEMLGLGKQVSQSQKSES